VTVAGFVEPGTVEVVRRSHRPSVVRQQHQVARPDVGAQAARRVGGDQRFRPQRRQNLQRQTHRRRVAAFVVMGPAAKHRDTHAFQITHHQLRVVPGHAGMRKAGQIGVVDGRAFDRRRKVPEPGAEDQPQPHGLHPGAMPHQPCEFSAP